MEVSTPVDSGNGSSLLASSTGDSDRICSSLRLGLYRLCILYLCHAFLTNLWNIVDIFGARYLRRWRKTPALLPLGLPLLGHALYFASNMPYFSYTMKQLFQDIPIKIRLFVMDNILVTRPEDIVYIFKQSANLTNKPYRKFVSNTFGVPEESRVLFAADETGLRHKSQPGATVKQEFRVDYLMHTFITQFMSGPSLGPLATRFTENLNSRLDAEGIDDEWREFPDLYEFVRDHMFYASLTAMFGEQLCKMKPDFCEEFWKFEKSVPDLAKGVPTWMNRSAIDARGRCLNSVQEWGTYLREQSTVTQRCDPVYDPVFGSEIVQKRHKAFAKMPSMGSKAIACEDLGLIWASTANAIHAAFWLVYQILRHPDVLPRFRAAIEPAMITASHSSNLNNYSIPELCGSALLQSLYTETLRLHVSNIILRSTLQDLNIRKWQIKRGEIISIMSYPMHQDKRVYNTGSDEHPRPLNEFWADRFLVPRADRSKIESMSQGPSISATPKKPSDTLYDFSSQGLEGSWIPYGGGSNICPGRQFAKQEMLLKAALLLGNFDIELTGPPVKLDYRFFGTGSMGVTGRTRFRMRKRQI